MYERPRPSRRSLLRGGVVLSTVSGIASVSASPARATTPRTPVIVGANPGIQLFDSHGNCTAYASIWQVGWSARGAGQALMLWTPRSVLVASEEPELARWLWSDYTRHFPELAGLPVPVPAYRRQPVSVDLDFASGLVARSGPVTVRMDGVLDRRWVDVPEFTLGDRSESLNLVFAPCHTGSITVAGRDLPGTLQRDGTPERPWTSAFLTEAEVWRG